MYRFLEDLIKGSSMDLNRMEMDINVLKKSLKHFISILKLDMLLKKKTNVKSVNIKLYNSLQSNNNGK